MSLLLLCSQSSSSATTTRPVCKTLTSRLNDVEAWDKSQLNWTGKMLTIMNYDNRLPFVASQIRYSSLRLPLLGTLLWGAGLVVKLRLLPESVPGHLRDLGAKRDSLQPCAIRSRGRRCRGRDDYGLLPYPVVQYHRPLRRSLAERRKGAE
jgi:hypothetical protein